MVPEHTIQSLIDEVDKPDNSVGNAARMPQTSDFYRYRELDGSKQQIRLARLLRSQPVANTLYKRDFIYCELEIFDINTAPEFIALSYTWGGPSDNRYIAINNKLLAVRMNLFDFLSAFRSDEANTQYLWIDQVGPTSTWLCMHGLISSLRYVSTNRTRRNVIIKFA